MMTSITATETTTGNTNVQAVAAVTGLRLMGYSVRESSGTPAVATLNIRHGTANTHTVLCPISLVASTTNGQWFGPQGIPAASGLYLERVSGNSTVTLFTAVVPGA